MYGNITNYSLYLNDYLQPHNLSCTMSSERGYQANQVKQIISRTPQIQMKDLITDKTYSQKVKGIYVIMLH